LEIGRSTLSNLPPAETFGWLRCVWRSEALFLRGVGTVREKAKYGYSSSRSGALRGIQVQVADAIFGVSIVAMPFSATFKPGTGATN
jgi:hypothetical protein